METLGYVLGIAGGVCAVIAGVLSSNGHRDAAIWLACLMCVFLIVGGFSWYQGKVWASAAASKALIPGTAQTPPEFADEEFGDGVVLILGTFAIWTKTFPAIVVQQRDEPMIVIERDDDGILVSSKFFSKDGKIIAQLVRNEIHLSADKVFRTDRTPHSLAVFDDEARKVFEAEFLNKQAIRIYGEFYLRRGIRARIDTKAALLGSAVFANSSARAIPGRPLLTIGD